MTTGPLKIAMLASAGNHHTHRWCRWAARQGHAVTLFSDDAPRPSMDYSEIPIVGPEWTLLRNIVTFKLRGGPYANNRDKWRAYAARLGAFAPDVLHAQEAFGYGPMLARFPGYPRVLTPWGPDIESLAGDDAEKKELVRAAVGAADVIATNAPGLEEHWSRLCEVPADRFRLFSWGTDTAVFRPRGSAEQLALRDELKIPRDATIVLSPRLALRSYGTAEMLDAWEAAEKPANALFVMLRAGADNDAWAFCTMRAQTMEQVRLIDAYLDPPRMAALYSASAAAIMLPETDLLASSVLECLACGALPLLAPHKCYRAAAIDLEQPILRRAGAIFLNGRTAGDIERGLRRLFALAPARLESLRATNAAHIAANEDWNQCAARMDAVYEDAIRRARERRP